MDEAELYLNLGYKAIEKIKSKNKWFNVIFNNQIILIYIFSKLFVSYPKATRVGSLYKLFLIVSLIYSDVTESIFLL